MRTFCLVDSDTAPRPLMERETVAVETPAARATSSMLAIAAPLTGIGFSTPCSILYCCELRAQPVITLGENAPGGLPKRPKGSDCKSDCSAFGGSNPSSTTQSSVPQAPGIYLFGRSSSSTSSPTKTSVGVFGDARLNLREAVNTGGLVSDHLNTPQNASGDLANPEFAIQPQTRRERRLLEEAARLAASDALEARAKDQAAPDHHARGAA